MAEMEIGRRDQIALNHTLSSGKRRFSPYKLVLFLTDWSVVMGGTSIILSMLTNKYTLLPQTSTHWTQNLLASFIILIFFPPHDLYNYHIIYSKKHHVRNLLHSLFWSLISFFIIYAFYHLQDIRIDLRSLLIIFLISLGLIIASRIFLEQFINNLVFSIGLGLLSFGILEMILQKEIPSFEAEWKIPMLLVGCVGLTLLIYRIFLVSIVFNRLLRKQFRRQLLFIGSDKRANFLADKLIRENAPFWVVGFLCNRKNTNFDLPVPKKRLGDIGNVDELAEIVRKHGIDEIIITNEAIDKIHLVTILDFCTQNGITVWFPTEYMPVIATKLKTNSFCGIPMIRLCERNRLWLSLHLKDLMDVTLSSILLILMAPLWAAVAAAIKLTSPGPVFYRARVYGKDANEFIMYKFRSMRVDSDPSIHKEYVQKFIKGEIGKEEAGDENKPFKIKDDPRITTIGKFIRKTSIDEFPQLLNVIRGEMSLVGPRPCLPYEFELYRDWHKKRLSVRPGITGLWQVAGRSQVPFEDMILLDLYYVYNLSMFLDLNILYETIFVVLLKKGAY